MDAGNGDANIKPTAAIKKKNLMDLYNDANVMPSIPLNRYPSKDKSKDDWSGVF